MTEFADLGCTHAGAMPRSDGDGHGHAPVALPRSDGDGHRHAPVALPAVVALPGACAGSLLHRCARGLRELNLQAMFYDV